MLEAAAQEVTIARTTLANPARSWSRPSWSRVDGIDCLRALAILYVLLNHVNMRLVGEHIHYLHGWPAPLRTALVWRGQQGVQIFFAISGFLITATSLRRWGSLARVNVREFYLIRFARIAPLLLTLVAVLSLLHALHLHDYRVSDKDGGLRGALWAAFTLRIGLLEATRGYLPGNWDILWSLSVEELFYLVFPLACRIFARRWAFITLLLVFAILGPFARTVLTHGNETWQEYSYLGGMDAIALGCLTALLVQGRTFSHSLLRVLAGLGAATMIFCLGFEAQVAALGLEKPGLGMSLLAVGVCLVMIAAGQTHWSAPRLAQPLLAYGRRSYEIYLTHMFVVFGGFNAYMALGHPIWLSAVLFIVVIALAGGAGELVGRFYSEPVNRWLRARSGDGAGTLGAVAAQPDRPVS